MDFSLQKINNDKNWDVEIDLKEIVHLLFNENDRIPVNYIKNRNTKILEADRVLLSKLLKNEKLKVLKNKFEILLQNNDQDYINKIFSSNHNRLHSR